jgi:hypothetical protein
MTWQKSNIFLGCDPEIFVTAENELFPAYKFLPPKQEAKLFNGVYTNARVFWDGFQAEFSLSETPCVAHVVDGIREGLRGVHELARLNNPTAKLTTRNVFQIPVKTLRSEKEEFVMLGCNPSQNVYGMLGEDVFDARKLRYRFAGGHIHFGISKFNFTREENESFVRALDAILGVWSVGAAANFDNPIRRKYYGLAGEYRLPKHGLEYRTLSNFWITHPGLANLVLMFARAVFGFWRSGLAKNWVAHPQEVVETINNCDVKTARKLLEINRPALEEVFSNMSNLNVFHPKVTEVQEAIRIGLDGLESVIPDPENFEQNWKLNYGSGWGGHAEGKMESWKELCQIKLAA